ncbi:MAG: 6-bladed beta-propeller [Candidatus Aminicenantes bacterium]|nr:6-bladed beta-propeller [Candidatus Aminicenantes bacterium]
MRPSLSTGRAVFLTLVLVFLLPILGFPQKPPDWKGKIEKEGDVVVVKNPNKPLHGAGVFSLEQDLAIGGEESADYVFAEISSVAVSDDGTIYVLDQKDMNVKVFDRDGKFLRTFGKAGEGPGEFSTPMSIHCAARDEILVVDMSRRLSFFKLSGEFVRTVSAGSLYLMDARPDSAGNFFVYLIFREEANGRYELRKVDGELKDLFVVESSPLSNSERDGFNPFFPILRWALLPGDRVVCGWAEKYEFRVHDAAGRIVRKIQMDPDPVPISKEDIDERTKGAPPALKQTMKIPKHYPAFRYFVTDDEDRIYVLTWERPPDRKGFYFDVFDRDGRYIVRTVLPVIMPLIRKGRLYAAEETAEGYPVLKRYKVGWKF